jgi:hypothetical protein
MLLDSFAVGFLWNYLHHLAAKIGHLSEGQVISHHTGGSQKVIRVNFYYTSHLSLIFQGVPIGARLVKVD